MTRQTRIILHEHVPEPPRPNLLSPHRARRGCGGHSGDSGRTRYGWYLRRTNRLTGRKVRAWRQHTACHCIARGTGGDRAVAAAGEHIGCARPHPIPHQWHLGPSVRWPSTNGTVLRSEGRRNRARVYRFGEGACGSGKSAATVTDVRNLGAAETDGMRHPGGTHGYLGPDPSHPRCSAATRPQSGMSQAILRKEGVRVGMRRRGGGSPGGVPRHNGRRGAVVEWAAQWTRRWERRFASR
jgi:hypothetical protein